MTLKGIDVSSWQGFIDWKRVKEEGHIDFAMVKCSEGYGYEDTHYTSNVSGARAHGILVGHYHFCRADLGNVAQNEMKWFDRCLSIKPGEPLALDIEIPQSPNSDHISEWMFLATMELKRLVTIDSVIIYSYKSFIENGLQDTRLLSNPLWLAEPSMTAPIVPLPWRSCLMWQGPTQNVPGIQGQVDINTFYGTRESFTTLGIGVHTAPSIVTGKMLQTSGIKPHPQHGGPNISVVNKGESVTVTPWTHRTGNERWQKIVYKNYEGWVPKLYIGV